MSKKKIIKYDNYHQDRAYYKEGKKFGYIDIYGNVVIPPIYDEVSDFSQYRAYVKIGYVWGYIDWYGNWIVKPVFEKAEVFTCGRAPVQLNGLWGYIDLEGQYVIQPTFVIANSFIDDYANVYISPNRYKPSESIIDLNCHMVVPPLYWSVGYNKKFNNIEIQNGLKEGAMDLYGFIVKDISKHI